MRFTSFIVAGLFAVAASAQSSPAETGSATNVEASTSVSIDPAQSSTASQIEQCLAKCEYNTKTSETRGGSAMA